MNYSKHIGGYFELELNRGVEFHQNIGRFDSGRSALRALIRNLNIKNVLVPYYTCPVVWQALEFENCNITAYDIDDSLFPILYSSSDTVLYTNYFGICDFHILELVKKGYNLIIDNSQAFFSPHYGIGTFWSPRKFFGVPDGGYAWPYFQDFENYQNSISWNRCSHLLKRFDLLPIAGLADFRTNEALLCSDEISKMSKLTHAFLCNINYDIAASKRIQNFSFLHNELKEYNILSFDYNDNLVPLCYPLRTNKQGLREVLIKHGIYVPNYWLRSNCTSSCMTSSRSRLLSSELIALPIDQRYTIRHMSNILEIILPLIK